MNEKEIRLNIFNIFLNYKRKKCSNNNCDFSNNIYDINNNCFDYHTKKDKRRFPFKLNNMEEKNFNVNYLEELYNKFNMGNNNRTSNTNINFLELEYSEVLIENYFEFINITNISKKDKILIDKNSSLNFIESSYHLKNFKEKRCDGLEACQSKYCNKYHNSIEKNIFKFIKTKLLNDINIFNKELKEIQKILTNINDISNSYKNKKELLNTDFKKEISNNLKIKKEINDSVKKKWNNNKKFNLNEIRPNFNKSKKFFYNEIVEFDKNKNLIFFNFLELKPTINTICALLNDQGGKIYFGIKNNIVKGISLIRQQIDEFQINLDNLLRNFNPGVFIHLLKINFFEISTNEFHESIIINKFVVRITVNNISNVKNIYLNNENNLCLFRDNKVIVIYKIKKIIDYIKTRIIINREKSKMENTKKSDSIMILINKINQLLSN